MHSRVQLVVAAALLGAFTFSCGSDEATNDGASDEPATPKRHMYVLGGRGDGDLATTTYRAPVLPNGELGPWEAMAEFEVAREAPSAAVAAGGTLIVAGGVDWRRPNIPETTVLVGDLEQPSSWVTDVTLPTVYLAAATVTRGKWLYVTGGSTRSGITENNMMMVVDQGSAKDPSHILPQLPEPVYAHAMVAVGGRLYVIGGETAQDTTSASVLVSTIEEHVGFTLGFDDAGALPMPRASHVAVATSRGIVVAGGRESSEEGVADTFLGTPDANGRVTWKTSTSLPAPRMEACAVSDGANVYVFGGHENANAASTSTVYVGRIAPNGSIAWSETTPLPEARYRHACAGY
jgi:Kelch motif